MIIQGKFAQVLMYFFYTQFICLILLIKKLKIKKKNKPTIYSVNRQWCLDSIHILLRIESIHTLLLSQSMLSKGCGSTQDIIDGSHCRYLSLYDVVDFGFFYFQLFYLFSGKKIGCGLIVHRSFLDWMQSEIEFELNATLEINSRNLTMKT